MILHILMADYCGMCNENGKEIGHSSKVLNEYAMLLNGKGIIDAALSPCIEKNVVREDFELIISLPYNINLCSDNSIYKRIKDKIKIFINIYHVTHKKNYNIIWFYKTDFFLSLYLWLFDHGRKKTKYIGLVYQESFITPFSPIVNWIFKRGIKKLDGLIYTQKNNNLFHKNKMYMPDYYYIPEIYDSYKKMKKIDKVVCVGTMNYYKELMQLVKCFNHSNYKLEICGYFTDKSMFTSLKAIAKSNVEIVDKILTQNEYYTKIATAKYSILPYNMQQYKERTSGVLYETIFLNSIPIAPKTLLMYNQIGGVAYDSWGDLEEQITSEEGLPPNYFVEYNTESISTIQKNLFELMRRTING